MAELVEVGVHALKIELEGLTASFRYPFFMLGRQPTFEMPPPATIYGLICSAVGELLDPKLIRFGYWFVHDEMATDFEHFLAIKPGKKGSDPFLWRGQEVHTNLNVELQPLSREFLFRPRMVLYLNRPDLEPAFKSPHYAVVLGRSQDLFTYTSVKTVKLVSASRSYIEHTIVPGALGALLDNGIATSMPRFIDYDRERTPTFGQYVMVHRRSRLTSGGPYLVDTETPEIEGCYRAVMMQGFVD